MESLHGTYMTDRLRELESLPPSAYAKWLADLAKKCFARLGDIKPDDVKKLGRNQSLIGLKRPAVVRTIGHIEAVRLEPTFGSLSKSMYAIAAAGEGICYAHEAWFDIAHALSRADGDEAQSPLQHLASIRNRLRYTGRKSREKLLSKTVLVKGLEFDHVVIANAELIGSRKDLYVAMTRPRRTLTILSPSPIIQLK